MALTLSIRGRGGHAADPALHPGTGGVMSTCWDQVTADEARPPDQLFKKRAGGGPFRSGGRGRRWGFALFFHNFSTFLGRAGLYLGGTCTSGRSTGEGIRKGDLPPAGGHRRGAGLRPAGGGGVWTGTRPASASTSPWGAEAMEDWDGLPPLRSGAAASGRIPGCGNRRDLIY